jgi:hypothetical protein
MKRQLRLAAALAAAGLTLGCTELSQESARSYAGKEDAKPYSGDEFKGDKAKWVGALAQRNAGQNDYARIPAAEKK